MSVALRVLPAEAMLTPPRTIILPDTGGVQAEKGIEFLRVTERVNSQLALPGGFNVDATAQWKTDWQTPEGEPDRIRQDGRWYAGFSRTLKPWIRAWLAAQGEHLDDRPYNQPPRAASGVDLIPSAHQYEDPTTVFTPGLSATAVRILRGGVGLSANPWKPFMADAGVGPVQDRRIGQMSDGVGVWTHIGVDHWNLAGYDQSLSLQYDGENPKNHRTEGFDGHYQMFREFFQGNSNLAEVSVNSLAQDVYLDAPGRSGRRIEQGYAIKDALKYGVMKGVQAQMAGDVTHQLTEQTQTDLASSSLEENQAGFATSLQSQYKQATAELEFGLRSITQSIRGDILQGHKSDLGLNGQLALPGKSLLALRASVSKYSLDTRSTSNYDDRDELQYHLEAAWSKPFMKTFTYEVHALTELDHLVYIYKQSSANNRWTRLFLLGSSVHHRPTESFDQTVTASVSANYQVYDFDLDPRTARSTAHRRVLAGDSLTYELSERFAVTGKVLGQQEEFGRLFWETFSEERSDQTRSLTAATELLVHITPTLAVSAGAMWDSRKGERFPNTTDKTTQLVFQDLRSYGPILNVQKTSLTGLFLNVDARVLRQFQLDHPTRWVSLGEMVGGFRW